MRAGVDCGGWRAPRCHPRCRRRRRRQCQYSSFRLRWLPAPAPTAWFGPAPHLVAVVLAPGLVPAGTTLAHCLAHRPRSPRLVLVGLTACTAFNNTTRIPSSTICRPRLGFVVRCSRLVLVVRVARALPSHTNER